MKNILWKIVFLSVISLPVFAGTIDEFNQHFRLLPQPQKIELLKTKGLLYSDIRSVLLINIKDRPLMTGLLSALPLTGSAAAGTVSLVIDKNLQSSSEEGYILEVSGKQVTIKASGQAGLFYGIQ